MRCAVTANCLQRCVDYTVHSVFLAAFALSTQIATSAVLHKSEPLTNDNIVKTEPIFKILSPL